MKFLGASLGLLVATACSGEPADTDDIADVGAVAAASSFQTLRADHRGDRDDHHLAGGRAVRRAIGAAAARIAALQADTIGDNARNGLVDADPDDGGWDFIISPSATEHTPVKSPTNLFGAIGLAAWAAVDTGSAGNRALVSALDAGIAMQRDPDIDSAPDFVFGVLLAELADNPGFAAITRQHYDAKVAAQHGAAGLGTLIRDARHRSREDGLIPYDLGWFVLAAEALDAAFPGAGYDRDADTYAGIVVDDLTSAAPLFNFRDPGEGFYVTGLAWAQVASSHLRADAVFQQVRAQLLATQHADGAWATSAAEPADDLQSTAHALQTIALTDHGSSLSRRAVRRATRWLLGGQAANGGWPDAAHNELPLVDADIALGLFLSHIHDPEDVLVPDAPSAATARSVEHGAASAAPLD
ncbi:MAG: hypothetical protein E6J91_26030 [Deltaproteobacteria bacterium]|nr:MAG: hypothetical protein E6J91_26030 [Deltaproteobacteria bacterium]